MKVIQFFGKNKLPTELKTCNEAVIPESYHVRGVETDLMIFVTYKSEPT